MFIHSLCAELMDSSDCQICTSSQFDCLSFFYTIWSSTWIFFSYYISFSREYKYSSVKAQRHREKKTMICILKFSPSFALHFMTTLEIFGIRKKKNQTLLVIVCLFHVACLLQNTVHFIACLKTPCCIDRMPA